MSVLKDLNEELNLEHAMTAQEVTADTPVPPIRLTHEDRRNIMTGEMIALRHSLMAFGFKGPFTIELVRDDFCRLMSQYVDVSDRKQGTDRRVFDLGGVSFVQETRSD